MTKKQSHANVRGVRNNNPGNIRLGDDWIGLVDAGEQTDKEFCQFKDVKYGIRAMAIILMNYQRLHLASDGSKIDQVHEFIARWAPHTDNNPTCQYSEFVCSRLNLTATCKIDIKEYEVMYSMIEAIIEFECGGKKYDKQIVDTGLKLAGIEPPQKSLKGSRTIKGASVVSTATIAPFITEQSQTIKAALEPYAYLSKYVTVLIFGLAMTGVGTIVWAKWDDYRQGRNV